MAGTHTAVILIKLHNINGTMYIMYTAHVKVQVLGHIKPIDRITDP